MDKDKKQIHSKSFIPGTDIEFSAVKKPEKLLQDLLTSQFSEKRLFATMVGSIISGFVRAISWLVLDMALYGPMTLLNSVSFFGRKSETSTEIPSQSSTTSTESPSTNEISFIKDYEYIFYH